MSGHPILQVKKTTGRYSSVVNRREGDICPCHLCGSSGFPSNMLLMFVTWISCHLNILLLFRIIGRVSFCTMIPVFVFVSSYCLSSRYAMALYNQHVCPVDNWCVQSILYFATYTVPLLIPVHLKNLWVHSGGLSLCFPVLFSRTCYFIKKNLNKLTHQTLNCGALT